MIRSAFIRMLALSTTLAGGSALAADLDRYPDPVPVEHTVVEFGSGWYLRGDIGYGVHNSSSGSYHSTTYGSGTSYAEEEIGHSLTYGVGFGYIFNDALRADLTIEHSDGIEWEGRSKSAPCGTVPGDCAFEAEAELKRTSILANAYYSIGGFGGFKPYIGAGVGVSDVSWSSYRFQQYCTVDAGEDCTWGAHSGGSGKERYDGPSGGVTTHQGLALTYALAAGIDYRLNENWTLDLGYKWTRISDSIMIEEDADGAGIPGGDSAFDAIDLHEVKVGLRYEIW